MHVCVGEGEDLVCDGCGGNDGSSNDLGFKIKVA